MKAYLRSSEGILALRPKITTIGKHDDSDILLKIPGLEDHHAAIELNDSEHSFILRDFNTACGTFVNDCHIQNAAVKVGPGDILRFGSSGPTFELVLDLPPQVPCPPVNRRIAWPGHIQVVTEATPPPAASQFPFLPSQQSPPANRSWPYKASGTSPHPPLKKRPWTAWGRTATSASFSPDAFSRPSLTPTGNGGLAGPLTSSQQMDVLLKERDEMILKLGNESSRSSALESEHSHKDAVIAELQNEISVMKEKVAVSLAKKEAEFHQKLVSLEKDVSLKTEEIMALQEQVTNLQKNTSEVLYRSISERDLQIAHWKQELEVMKKNYSLTTGLVTSLQKDVVSKEQKIQQLKLDTEKLKQENREKDNQIVHISAQCSRIKEETKRELRERDVNTYQARISELELQVKRSKEEIKKRFADHQTLSSRLMEVTKAEGELKDEGERRSQQVQELVRRERLLRSELEQATAQVQHFRNQVMKVLFSEPLPEKPLTDQQIVEKLNKLKETTEKHSQKEVSLKEKLQNKALQMEETSSNIRLLKKALDGFQDFLKSSYCGSSLRKEIVNLQNLSLAPPVSGIQISVSKILCNLLCWVAAVESLLRDVGMDASAYEKGMDSYMKQLLDQSRSTMAQLQTLQNQLKTTEESQQLILQGKLKELKEKLEEEFQTKERKLKEEEKEQNKVLAMMDTLEKAKLQEAIDAEKKRVHEFEARVKEMVEIIDQKTRSEGSLNTKINKTLEALEEAKRRKTVAEEKLSVLESHLKRVERESELLKQKHQKEISEHQEQVKQHARTIVHLESKLREATQQAKKAREECNLKQLEKKEPCDPLPPTSHETLIMEELHRLLKEELAAAKQEIQSNQATISELKKELSKARATISDIKGELSEKQKVELEENQSLAQSQAQELNHLREKLLKMSQLVEQKEADLQGRIEELRKNKEKVKEQQAKTLQHTSTQTKDSSLNDQSTGKLPPVLDLADLGARCKGSRHEETIHRQKEALAELRKKLKMLEIDSEAKLTEPLVVFRKGPAEKQDPKKGEVMVTALKVAGDAQQPPSGISNMDPNMTIERTARLELADALELSENLYFTFVRDLSSLLNGEELTGMQTLKHLPKDEREKVIVQRQKDLERLLDIINKLKSRLEKKECLLKEYEGDVGQLRYHKQTVQAYQSEMARLADSIYRIAEEKTLLKEALDRTKLQLSHEKKLNKALKKSKGQLEEMNEVSSRGFNYSLKSKDRKMMPLKKPASESNTAVRNSNTAVRKSVESSKP